MNVSNSHQGGGNPNGLLTNGDKDALRIMYPTFSGGAIEPEYQTVTTGEIPEDLANKTLPVGAAGTITYTWERKIPGGTWATVTGTDISYYFSSPLTTTGIHTYRRKATAGGQSVYSNEAVITVQAATLTPGTIGPAQTIAYGTAPAQLTGTAPTGGTSYQYQWQQSTDNSNWSNVPVNGSNTGKYESYQPPVLTALKFYRRAVTYNSQTVYSNSVLISVVRPGIAGMTEPPVGAAVSYNFYPAIPAGITFHEWEVVSGPYVATSGLTNPNNLVIAFNSVATYTVRAKFKLPDGSNYPHSAEKTINVRPLPITGPDYAVPPNTPVDFSVSPPSGVTFNGWNVSPSSYTVTGGTGAATKIKFSSVGQYTVSANFILPGGTSYVATTTVSVEILPLPTIIGPDTAITNMSTTYHVPNGYTFNGWSTSSGVSLTTWPNNSREVSITFSDGQVFTTLTANFTLSDGSNYSVQKNIRSVTLPLIKPVLGFSDGSNHYVFYNRNYYQYGVFYQWQINGMLLDPTLEIYQIAIRRDGLIETSGSVSVLGNLNLDPYYPTQLNVRCRAVLVVDGTAHQYSDWSDWVSSQ